jgi:hypothetical protein
MAGTRDGWCTGTRLTLESWRLEPVVMLVSSSNSTNTKYYGSKCISIVMLDIIYISIQVYLEFMVICFTYYYGKSIVIY